MLNKPTGDMLNAAGSATPQGLGTASAGTATAYSREDHVHVLPTASQIGAVGTSDVISISHGGTGAITATAARTALEITPANIGAISTDQQSGFATLTDGTLTTSQVAALTGDVTSTAGSPATTVVKLHGNTIASTTPSSGQVLTWDGAQWAPATNSSGGGGGANGLTYYLNQGTAADAPTTGITGTPHQLGRTGESGQTTVTTGTLTQNVWTLVAGFVSESTPIDPDVTLIPAGLWDFNIWAYGDANSNAGTSIRCRVYKYNGSTLTEIASPSSSQVINGTSAQYSLSVLVPQTTLELTDRIYVAIEAQATANGHNVTAQFGDSTPSHVHTSLPLVGGTGLWKSLAGVLQSPASLLVNADVDAAAGIAWSKIAPSYFGAQVKVVGRDAATIQGCIDLCTSASSTNPFTVLIPPKAGNYVEALTLKGSVALIGLTNALNSDAIQIEGSHTYAPDLASGNSNRIGFENLTFISASLTANTISVVAGTGGVKYASQIRFSGCVFSGGKNSGVSHISTCDNVSLYIDNSRFESSTGNSGSVGITQGNGPLYINNNTVFDVFGKALDIPASTTVTKTATSTFGSYTLTVSDVTGLSVGQKISGTGLYSTTTVVSITAPSTVVMSTPPQTATAGFIATFGQTPYVEIHDAVLAGKGTDVVTLGSGLLTATNVNFSSSTGNGINLASEYTVLGLVNCSFGISITTAGIYVITGAANTHAALNSVSYSNSALSSVFVGIIPAYNTSINSNVTVYDYAARSTSIENGGTGQITRQAALNALAGAVTANQVLAGNGTNITLRALAAADIPSLAASKITSGTLAAAQGGTGTTAGITNINTTQIAALTTAQTANLIPKLTTSGLISLAQLGGIGTTQISALTTAQTANLVPQLTTSGLISLTQLGGIGTTQISALTTAQTANFIPQLNASGQIYTSQIATLNQNTTGSASKATNLIGGNSTTLLGSVPYQSNTDTTTLLAPNTTATKKFLRQTGTGTNGAAPAWDTIVAGDIPTLNQNTTGTAANVTGNVAIGNGGTGASDAPTARANLSVATFAEYQIITTSGTIWTKPAGAKMVEIQLFGGGGGGGSGRRNSTTATAKSGGAGGSGGSYLKITAPASLFNSSETVTIGAGGAGGAAVATDGTNGNAGGDGGYTAFNAFRANGGGGGAGGTAAAVGATAGVLNSNTGSGSPITSAPSAGSPGGSTSPTEYGGAGGAAGGGISATNTEYAGGNGGRSNVVNLAGGAGSSAGGGNASDGVPNSLFSLGAFAVGSGGGGGSGAIAINGGGGGNGGFPASGGGGGGATAGTASGFGGSGANGAAMIITYF